jgi:LuxR family maltose regulon positive regulatory protein
VVLVDAPAGYGKTTAVAQWAVGDGRPVAWLTIADDARSAAPLTDDIVQALAVVPELLVAASVARAGSAAGRLGRLVSALRHTLVPFVLVLDEVDRLDTGARSAVRSLAAAVPIGSHLVLVARASRHLSASALTAGRERALVGTTELAMTVDEAAELFRGEGLVLGTDEVESLVGTTRGWPAALVLAASSILRDADPDHAARAFNAADPIVEDYLESEVLSGLSTADRKLLAACSVIRRLTGPECDAILATSGSAQALNRLARKVGPVLRKEIHTGSYELHPLVGDLLRTQLERRDPARARRLQMRASEWHEERREFNDAILLARAADEPERAARLIWQSAPLHARTDPIMFARWMELWSDEEIIDDPVLCVCAACGAFCSGDLAGVHRWATFARRAEEDLVLPGGTPLRSVLALYRALSGRNGLHSMVDDARLAAELDRGPASALARYARGSAYRLLGDAERSRAQLEAAAQTSRFDPSVEAHCIVQLALLALDQGARHEALTLAATAKRRIAETTSLVSPPTLAAYVALAYFDTVHGSAPAPAAMIDRLAAPLPRLDAWMPWLTVDARLLLAATALSTGDADRARNLAHEAGRVLAASEDTGLLVTRLEELRAAILREHRPLGVTASGLTAAEVRVLAYLPTHLTFPEIAEALFVSRHTVKTQAVAVYRKLGVNSRSAAVAAARELGLLED